MYKIFLLKKTQLNYWVHTSLFNLLSLELKYRISTLKINWYLVSKYKGWNRIKFILKNSLAYILRHLFLFNPPKKKGHLFLVDKTDKIKKITTCPFYDCSLVTVKLSETNKTVMGWWEIYLWSKLCFSTICSFIVWVLRSLVSL